MTFVSAAFFKTFYCEAERSSYQMYFRDCSDVCLFPVDVIFMDLCTDAHTAAFTAIELVICFPTSILMEKKYWEIACITLLTDLISCHFDVSLHEIRLDSITSVVCVYF